MVAAHEPFGAGPTPPLDVSRRSTAQLPASPASPRMARDMVREVTGRPENARVALIVTELVTNAVNHAGAAPAFTVVWDGSMVRIEVADDGPGRPVVRQVEPTATQGRGMALVDAVADEWGVDESPGGKTVWAEISFSLDFDD